MQPMPRVPPLDRSATYDDLIAFPEIYLAEIELELSAHSAD